jgi:hypothetical protein
VRERGGARSVGEHAGMGRVGRRGGDRAWGWAGAGMGQGRPNRGGEFSPFLFLNSLLIYTYIYIFIYIYKRFSRCKNEMLGETTCVKCF